MKYQPPTTQDLARLKEELGFTGKQMADLFGLSGDQQWRKYTGGHDPRPMSVQMLFFAIAKLELDDSTIEKIINRMTAVGAKIDLREK